MAVANVLADLTLRLGLEWRESRSPFVIGAFHDLCKLDDYAVKQNSDGHYEFFRNKSTKFSGHGDKSVKLIQNWIDLTGEEEVCIRYHMGVFSTEGGDMYTEAIRRCNNVLYTHTADMIASVIQDV